MNEPKKITQAPPWLIRLLTPMIARFVSKEMIKKYPDLSADEIVAKMRADIGTTDVESERFLAAVAQRLPSGHVKNQAVSRAGSQAINPTPISWYSPTSLILIAANLLPLYGVFMLDWQVFPIMLLFWLENVVIGILNALRMLLVDPADLALWGGKLVMVPFFCFHYGMFTAIHGVFVFALFGRKQYDHLINDTWTIDAAQRAITDFDLGLALLALAASHLFSFIWNYLIRGEFRRTGLSELMHRPYKRIIILHLTIIFGGFIIQALGSPLWALLLLIGLKIGFDLKAHIKEHQKAVE